MGRERVFRMKHFSVVNDQAAMRVGTDGVLLGAWCPVPRAGAARVLDVGTGCGLIALMVAQRCPAAKVTALEIDEAAAREAAANFAGSPWPDRLACIHGDFCQYGSSEQYDLIVSNPPYFSNSLQAPGAARTTARHDTSLTLPALIGRAGKLLSSGGRIALITPVEQYEAVVEASTFNSLFVREIVDVISVEGKPAKRLMWLLGHEPCTMVRTALVLEDREHNITPQYRELCKDFYLRF